ncbi:MAG: hypothetical protein EOM67_16010, partial [Spirochaetia bacterium]|nr:hypothetical protein [Spirochaetia bacterium]
MSKRCITTNSTIEELAAKLQGETIESVKGLVELWQDKNNKDWDTYPTASELNNFRAELRKGSYLGWARTASNSYEVSTRGDKRFSAFFATLKKDSEVLLQDSEGNLQERKIKVIFC